MSRYLYMGTVTYPQSRKCQKMHYPKAHLKLHHLRSQTKNQKLMEKGKARDAQESYLYLTPPAAHLEAPKTRDPRKDPNRKAVDEDAMIRGRDHKRQTSSGPLGSTTLKDML